ncbi:STAS/SEC14 domain-containing protein [Hymenobacter sp. DG25A]|uniref:STAS/SEC14 domain-containing protein n=1 Tax=Hymenobacter sp. DG25A TaxID=1385663 RepID=UPI0006C8E4F4|nr:STAS/SEC14 domain-containing protein [Hymenobacter sp. DG25A]
MIIQELSSPAQPRFCTISYEPAADCVVVTWEGSLGADEAKQGAQKTLEVLRELRPSCVLNDNSRVMVMWFETLHWIEQHWAPIATTYGLRHMAHVTHPDTYHIIMEIAMQHNFSPYFDLQLFDDVAQAQDWLQHCRELDATTLPRR